MKEKEIVEKLVNAFAEIEDAKAIASTDFSEERENNMIVVGVETTTQVNVGLPDFEYRVSIVVDCFIEGDADGENFNNIHKNVRRVIDEYEHKDKPLDSLFEEIPVVGFFFENEEEMIDDKSNRVVLYCNVIASF